MTAVLKRVGGDVNIFLGGEHTHGRDYSPPKQRTQALGLENVAAPSATSDSPEAGGQTALGAADDAPAPQRSPAYGRAVSEIAGLLAGSDRRLRSALEARLDLPEGAPPRQAVAERLCAVDEDTLATAFDALRGALNALPGVGGDRKTLAEQATAVLEWMVITAVSIDYDAESRDAIRRWNARGFWQMPMRRNHSIEVITARWHSRRAYLGKGAAPTRAGEDDITVPIDEIGFDDPSRLEPSGEVNALMRLLHQRLWPEVDLPDWINPGLRNTINRKLRNRVKDHKRRWRFIIDPDDHQHPIQPRPELLQRIAAEIPDLQLIMLAGGGTHADADRVFVMLSDDLAGEIDDCLDCIARLT